MPRALANAVELEYDTFGDDGSAPLLLITGAAMQMIAWDERFCELLASRGFYVVRFDNRDAGLSTRFDRCLERSPLLYIHRARTPTLIAQGEADERCPLGQALEMFVSLKNAGCDVELVRYPGASHLFFVNGHAEHRVDFLDRVLAHFKARLPTGHEGASRPTNH